MKKFIIISGPIGVGKTVAGKLLCDKIGRAAFIDGDWCLDIHPFIGNTETKNMAVDNIIHLTRNYFNCSECDMIVLSWVMSEKTIQKIITGLTDLEIKPYCITLICDRETLIHRWRKDTTTDWRTDEWLAKGIKSIDSYKSRTSTIIIDTSKMTVNNVVDEIINKVS